MSTPRNFHRGWCPDMLRPMATADGLLVRIHPAHASLSSAQARIVAEGAGRFGNGLLDLSSRGNIQIRGVRPDTHPPLVETLIEAGLLAGLRDESPFRLTTLSPLAGEDPRDFIDAALLTQRIEDAGRPLRGLHPKTAIVVDGGGSISLDRIEGDLRLTALDPSRVALGIARPEGLLWSAVLPVETAPEAVRTILAAAARNGQRAREMADDDLAPLLRALPSGPPQAPPRRADARRAGALFLEDRTAMVLAAPWGRCNAPALTQSARWSEQWGDGRLRLSPFKALVIPTISAEGAIALPPLARDAGFIVDEDDARLAISACPGMDGCERGSTPTHADANRIAASFKALDAEISIHVSGCPKGCAHPSRAALTLVGDGDAYQVVLDGSARHKPLTRAGIDEIAARLAIASNGTDLMRLFGTEQS